MHVQRSEHGNSLLELALVLPVLMLLVLGALDLSVGFRTAIVLQNASREGARYWSLNPDDRTGAVARVNAEITLANLPGLTPATITVSLDPGSGKVHAGRELTVIVWHNHPLLFGAVTGMPLFPLRAETHMVALYD